MFVYDKTGLVVNVVRMGERTNVAEFANEEFIILQVSPNAEDS